MTTPCIEDRDGVRYRVSRYSEVRTKWNESVTLFSWVVCMLSMMEAGVHWLIPIVYIVSATVIFPSAYFTIKFMLFQKDCLNNGECMKSGGTDAFLLKFDDNSVMYYGDYSKEVVLDSNFWNATISFVIAFLFFFSITGGFKLSC